VTDARGDSRPLPDLTFTGGHPTVPDPSRPGALVCVCCEVIDGFTRRRCVRGLVVHLIEPDELDRFKGSPWVQADAIAAARTWWLDRAAVITRAVTAEHPRFQVCPLCTVARMAAGEIPYTLPPAVPPVITRR
jgi:hypothetical protein